MSLPARFFFGALGFWVACAPSSDDGPAPDAGVDASLDAAAVPEAGTDASSVACGASECQLARNPLAVLLEDFGGFQTMLPATVPCCVDSDSGECGIAQGAGATCERLAVPDARCPGLDLSMSVLASFAEGMNVVGCCVDDACGQDGALLGRGCIENDEASATLSVIPVLGSSARVPAARSCNVLVDAGR